MTASTKHWFCKYPVTGLTKLQFLGTLLLFFCLPGVDAFAQQTFRATLTGMNEAPSVVTPARGEIEATLNGNELVITGSFTGLSSNLRTSNDAIPVPFTHIHTGYAGQNGPVSIQLVPLVDENRRGGTFVSGANIFTLTEQQVQALNERRFYINIHSVDHPAGEIRGQLLPNAPSYFMANLYGSNQVPSVISNGNGQLVMELRANNELVVTGSFSELESNYNTNIGSHLHTAFAGRNGEVTQTLNPTVSEDGRSAVYTAENNTYTLTAAQVSQLNERRLYANIHSTEYPGGELRGQVVEMADIVFRAHLSGSNERPAVTTMATGELMLELRENTLRVSGSFQGLESAYNSEVGSHLHLGFAGQNGGVEVPLTAVVSEDGRSGTFAAATNLVQTLTAAQKQALINRQMYANIHSTDYPAGELRGQVVPLANYFFNGFISAANEVTPVVSLGTGGAIAEIRGTTMVLTGSFSGLQSNYNTSVGSHIHVGLAGTNGPVVIPLEATVGTGNREGTFMPASNTFDLTEENRENVLDNLRARRLYVNIHSVDNPGGEVRAQLLHEATTYFSALLSGASETNPVNTPATGHVLAEVTGMEVKLSGSFMGLTSDYNVVASNSGAHIHEAIAGTNGGVDHPLNPDLTENNRAGDFLVAENTIMLEEEDMMALRERRYYVNIHSTANPMGEIRGQMLPLATHYFTTSLSSMNEVQPVEGNASGGAKFEINGTTVTVSGSFNGLESNYNQDIGSHLHIGGAGENGNVVFPLTVNVNEDNRGGVFRARDNRLTLTAEQIATLIAGRYYLNVHSTDIPSGEVRGQVLPEINFYPTADAAITAPAEGTALTVEGDPETEFRAQWSAATDPNNNPVAYIWQLSAEENFSTILLESNVGTERAFVSTLGAVAGILQDAGVAVGSTITLYHRVLATDGSLITMPAESASVVLTRGVITSIRQLAADGVSVYPSPADNSTLLAIHALKHGKGSMVLTDIMGRVLSHQPIQVTEGTNEFVVDLGKYKSGMYLIKVSIGDETLPIQKVVKR